MIKSKNIFFILIIIGLNLAYSEVTSDTLYILDKPGGKVLFKIFPEIEIYYKYKDNIYIVSTPDLKMSELQILNDMYSKNDLLKDEYGNIIGVALENIVIDGYYESFVGGVVLHGYTSKIKIKRDSIIEYNLTKIINKTHENISYDDIAEHINRFGYDEYIWDSPISEKSTLYMTTYGTMYPSEIVMALFFQDDILIAIMYRNKMNIISYFNFNIHHYGDVDILAKYTDDQNKMLEDSINKYFNSFCGE